jgi:hypothetical protein
MKRPAALALLATLVATSVLAQPIGPERLDEPRVAFYMIDKFYAVPAADRSELKLTYKVLHGVAPAPKVHLTLVVDGKRTPLPIAADGRVERLPTEADLAAHAMIALDVPRGYISIPVDLGAAMPPAREIDPARCALAIDQANGAIRRAFGMLAFIAPRVGAVTFPGAGSGVAVMADGKTRPLPLHNGAPTYVPGPFKEARTLRLARTPNAVVLE